MAKPPKNAGQRRILMRMVFLVLGAAVLCVVGMTAFPRANENEPAGRTVRQTTGSDGGILFANGTIYINADKKAHNLLVKDGSVAGWNVQAGEHPSATTVDLKGATAYPGFIDSHCHLMEAGTVLEVGADLASCKDVDSIVNKLAEKIKSVPENGVVMGVGFSLTDYDKWSLQDLAKIDKVTGNRPAFLVDQLGHNAIINTATMKSGSFNSRHARPSRRNDNQGKRSTDRHVEGTRDVASMEQDFCSVG